MRKRKSLDTHEREILKSYNKGELRSVPRLKEDLVHYRAQAQAHMRKNMRINIRLSEQDLSGIRHIAMEEGIPYQTLISSIIHKHVAGTR